MLTAVVFITDLLHEEAVETSPMNHNHVHTVCVKISSLRKMLGNL